MLELQHSQILKYRTTTVDEATAMQWAGEKEFVCNVVALIVGFGNVLKFPYLCYSFGGGIFLIPYFICLICVGFPLMLFEFSIGQLSCGVMNTWMICPLFAGIGRMTTYSLLLVCTYYIVDIAWVLWYCFLSLKSPLPWKHCGKEWSTFYCRDNLFDIAIENCTGAIRPYANGTCYNVVTMKFNGIYNRTAARAHGIKEVLPAEEYKKYVSLKYGNSNGLHDLGSMQWHIVFCLSLIWLMVIGLQALGVRIYRKVAFTVCMLLALLLFLLFIKTLTLHGSGSGIKSYLYPDAFYLFKKDIWIRAFIQAFFSLSLTNKCLERLATYNKFHFNIVRDAFICVSSDTLVSFFSGFIVFGFLGSFAHRLNVDVNEVVSSGYGLLFVVLPQELANETTAASYNLALFLMCFLIGFSSHLLNYDIVMAEIADQLHLAHRNRKYLSGSLGLALYMIQLSMCSEGGVYINVLLGNYATSWNTILAALLMTLAILLYGAKRLCDDVERMVGLTPLFWIPWKYMKWYFIATWSVITPLILFVSASTYL